MEEDIAGQDVGVRLCAALGVDDSGDASELAEDVEAVNHQQQLALQDGT